MRSRKGSVTTIRQIVEELLPRGDIFLLHRLFQARSRGSVQTKTFRKDSEASSRAARRRGYVILVSNEPSCYHAATSERRRIRLKADYYYIALRGASFRRSQRGNSEAVFFRGTLPRRYSIRRSRCGNSGGTALTVQQSMVHTYDETITATLCKL